MRGEGRGAGVGGALTASFLDNGQPSKAKDKGNKGELLARPRDGAASPPRPAPPRPVPQLAAEGEAQDVSIK